MNEKPRITIQLRDNGAFQPVTAYDAEQLALCSGGQKFSLLPVANRSPEHHKLYWSLLGKIVKATGKWPTSEHLHRELKISLGYYQIIISEFGGVFYMPDSIAMSKMDQKQFNDFFDAALQKLSETIGFDPFDLLNDQ